MLIYEQRLETENVQQHEPNQEIAVEVEQEQVLMGSKDEALRVRIDHLMSCTKPDSLRHSIFKVPTHLYRENSDEKLYEPQLVSIGPYHRGKDHLKAMEVYKILYLQQLLRKTTHNTLPDYLMQLRKMVPMVRECYAGSFDGINEDAFVEMMLLDGCFIVELIRYSEDGELKGENAHSLTKFTLDRVKRDLLLLENQLPFFFTRAIVSNDYAKGAGYGVNHYGCEVLLWGDSRT